MKRTLVILTLACALFGHGTAKAQRGLPGELGLQLSAGFVDGFSVRDSRGRYRYFGSLALTRTNRNHTHWTFGVSCLRKDYDYPAQPIPKAQFLAEVGLFVPLLATRSRNVSFQAGVSAAAGYETSA